MATDTFTCSRCGQVSYYRDGSYLFGQAIVCARCYAAQAAPPVPVAGLAPQGAVPAAYPPPPMGYPGGPAPYAPPQKGSNLCGLLGFICPFLALGCLLIAFAGVRAQWSELQKILEKAQQNPNNQEAMQKEVRDWATSHPELQGPMLAGGGGAPVFLLLGLVLSIIGVCLSNVRKGLAIAGLIINGLVLIGPCLLTCAGGALS